MFSAALGRWMQQDPAGYVNGMNIYAFEMADPVMLTDAEGLDVGGADAPNTNPGTWNVTDSQVYKVKTASGCFGKVTVQMSRPTARRPGIHDVQGGPSITFSLDNGCKCCTAKDLRWHQAVKFHWMNTGDLTLEQQAFVESQEANDHGGGKDKNPFAGWVGDTRTGNLSDPYEWQEHGLNPETGEEEVGMIDRPELPNNHYPYGVKVIKMYKTELFCKDKSTGITVEWSVQLTSGEFNSTITWSRVVVDGN